MENQAVKYFIDYGTGAGNLWMITKDLNNVKQFADESASYTQESILILDESGEEVTRRTRVGCCSGVEDQDNPITFGDFGYYADWSD